MSYRRMISKGIQNELAAIVLRDSTLGNNNYYRKGDINLGDARVADFQMKYIVLQQRPYSTAFIQVYAPGEQYWAIGNSKCIGVHNGHKPDKWDHTEGMRLAIARAAADIGDQLGQSKTVPASVSEFPLG